MIVATREFIYGLDVYSFYNSQRIPYQLTFDDTLNPKHTEVSLVNLLGLSDCTYCKYLRVSVCQYIYEHILENRCEVYFSVEIVEGKGISLLKKFVRWMEIEKRITADITITPLDDEIQFIEFKLDVNPSFVRDLKVKKTPC